MLPLNLYRLHEMYELIRRVRLSSRSDLDMTWLHPFMTRRKVKAGEALFRKSDTADAMYLVVSGRFELHGNQDGGEARYRGRRAWLARPRRAANAVADCLEDGEVMELDYDRFEQLYFQNPQFGLAFLKLTSRRLFQKSRGWKTSSPRGRRRHEEQRVSGGCKNGNDHEMGCAYIRRHRKLVVVSAMEPCGCNIALRHNMGRPAGFR